MPARTDKLDAMILAASVTGFEFDVLEGVQGDAISKKALSGVSVLPFNMEDFNADSCPRNGSKGLGLKEWWVVGGDT